MEADGSVIIKFEADDKQALAELTRLQNRIRSITEQMEARGRKRSILAEQAKELEAQYKSAISAGQDAKAEELAKQYDRISSKIATIDQQLKFQQADLAATTEKAGQYAAQLSQIPTTMQQTDTQTEKTSRDMEKLGDEGGKAAEKINSGMRGATSGIAKFGKRIIGLAKRVFVFSLITRALRNVRSWLGNLISTNNEASAALASLKGAFLTLAQPILNAVIPALTKVLNVLAALVTAIASLVSSIFGTTVEQSAAAAEALNNEQNALGGVGGAAKKAAKQLANFDEINKLAGEDAGGGGGGSSSIAPNFDLNSSWLEKIKGWADKTGITDAIQKVIAAIGKLRKGIEDFMNSDAGKTLKKVLTQNFVFFLETLAGTIALVASVLGGDLFGALDALQSLTLSPVLNALIVLADILDLFIPKNVKEDLFGGKGLGDFARNLKEWVNELPSVTEAWETAKDGLHKAWDSIGIDWGALWNGLEPTLSSAWKKVKEWWAVTKSRIYDAWSLAKHWWNMNIQPKLEAAFQPIKDAWDSLVGWFDEIETALDESGTTLGEAFVGGLKVGLSGIVTAINAVISVIENALNWIVRKINSISFDVPNSKLLYGDLAGQHVGFNIQPISIPRVNIPQLAQGAVIPPNREFLAVLGDQQRGTNVEAPLETIVQAVRQALGGNRQTIVLELDRRELGRAVADVSKLESQRVGIKIGGSYA